MTRKLNEISIEIEADMKRLKGSASKGYPTAWPYLNAMFEIEKLSDKYGYDSGKIIVLYFLVNVSTWRGEAARRLKKELNDMVKAAS